MTGKTRQLKQAGHFLEHAERRCRRLGAAALSLAILLGVGAGCGTESSSGDGDSSSLDCDAVVAAATSGVPLTRVALAGLAGADTDDDFVRVEAEGYPAYPTALYGNAVDGYEVLVPPHPDGPGGGALRLLVTDGGATCPAIAFDVLPLPAHAGDPIADLVDALNAIADAFADRYDVDPADLFATPLDELPPELVPLAVLFEGLDAVDLEDELAALDPEEVELLQDLLAVIDLAPLLEAFAGEVEALPLAPPPPSTAFYADAVSPSAALAGSTPLEVAMAPALAARSAAVPRAASAGDCVDLGAVDKGRFDVSTPERLADYLATARGAADSIGPLQRGISDLNSGFVALGLVPGTGWGGFAIGQLWSWGSYMANVAQQMRANLYPSSITRLTFEVDETRIPEDWDASRAGKIEWSFAKLYSANNGMNLSRVVADGTTNVVSSATRLSSAAGNAAGFIKASELQAVKFADVAGRDAINERLDELEEDEETIECWNIGATEFGPTVVEDDSKDEWVVPNVVSGESITVDDREITPARTGVSTLRIETNTQNLPGPRGFADRVIEVARKSVTWLPEVLFIEKTNQPELVKVRFDDTKHYEAGDVSFEYDENLIVPFDIPVGGGLFEIRFNTPDNRQLYPLEIKATSKSKDLPPDTAPRSATLLITTKESIEISPRNRCVPNGQDLELTAAVSSIDAVATVEWEKTGAGNLILPGDLGQTISYVAPASGAGQVTLRASLASDAEIKDEVTLSYGNCVPLAIFYEFDGGYNVPGADPGCLVYEGGDQFEIRNDNEDNDGKNPEIPLSPGDFWVPGQTFSIAEADGTPGQRGNGNPESCATGTFPAEYSNWSAITVGASGDQVTYDIDLLASATCDSFSDGAEACSGAQSYSAIWARYDLEIDAAKTYRIQVDMSCSTTLPLPIPIDNITVGFYRVDSSGEAILTNRDFDKAKFIETASCHGSGTATIDVTFEVDAPLASGSTDRLTVYAVTALQAVPRPELTQDDDSASLTGTIRLSEVAD